VKRIEGKESRKKIELLMKIVKWGANRGVLVKLGRKGGLSSRPV
jgi:hypothetical protein